MRTKLKLEWMAAGLALAAALVGCVGYVDGGGVGVIAPVPEVTVFGGYDHYHDVHVYSHRGFESRGFHRR